jgi:hypothetical protein
VNHYEELGLTPEASTDEIRHAYRQLVRLLHPDHCTDEALRHAAELQMRRLNSLLATLTDEERRTAYDRSLEGLPPAGGGRAVVSAWWRRDRMVWWAAGLVVVMALVGLVRDSPPPAAASAPRPAEPQAQAKPATRPKPAPSRRASPPRVRAADPVRELPDEAVVERRTPRPEGAGDAEVLSPASPAMLEREPETAPARAHRLAGNWFFVASPGKRPEGLYPPEYIELYIREEEGRLIGKYRARYRVGDRAISPGVVFQFYARPAPETLRAAWRGAGGASGHVSVRLLTEGCLEVNWVATQLSDELGLISGTATLIRRIE